MRLGKHLFRFLVLPAGAGMGDPMKGSLLTLADVHYTRLLRRSTDWKVTSLTAPLTQQFVRQVVTVVLPTGERVDVWAYLAAPKTTAAIATGKLVQIAGGEWPIDRRE